MYKLFFFVYLGHTCWSPLERNPNKPELNSNPSKLERQSPDGQTNQKKNTHRKKRNATLDTKSQNKIRKKNGEKIKNVSSNVCLTLN